MHLIPPRRTPSLILLASASLLAGCSRGACENTQAFTGTSDAIYKCLDDQPPDLCDNSYSDVNFDGDAYTVDQYFHQGTTCSELGYAYDCPGGMMADAECSGRTAGSGGGTGGGCGTSTYGGPYYDDYQVESQCEALYAYGCSAEARESICEILDQWAQNGVPNVCPYC